MLNNEVDRNPVVPVPRDNDVCVGDSRVYKVPERIFDELVVLFENPHNCPSSFCNVPFDPPAEPYIV